MTHIDTSYRHLTSSPPASSSLLQPAEDELESLLPTSLPRQPTISLFSLIHTIRALVTHTIDVAYPYSSLMSPPLSYTLIRPLHQQLPKREPALLYALLLNRVQFGKEAEGSVNRGVEKSRANTCEVLAGKVLEEWTGEGKGWESGGRGLELITVLTTPWNPFGGVSQDLFDENELPTEEELEEMESLGEREMMANAIEIAIFSSAKKFVGNPFVQQVLQAIWNGEIVYTPLASHSIIKDNYKCQPVHIYSPHFRPILDHYRLRVPRIRALLEFFNFSIILILFMAVESTINLHHVTAIEGIFIAYVLGYALDELSSSMEHGFYAYSLDMWNYFDTSFLAIFFVYLGLRCYALTQPDGTPHHTTYAAMAFDILALGACILFPRLAGSLLSNNVVILGLNAMFRDFATFLGLAAICASGFLFSFWVLARGHWSLGKIAWLMLEIWFGNNFIGFSTAEQFHPFFGPLVFIIYAMLANTLLLTILIAILSTSFARVQQSAAEEFALQKAIQTIERVKGDVIYSYQPPFNLVALAILFPLRFIVSERWFHKFNVTLIRIFHFPLLLGITIFERMKYRRFGKLSSILIKDQDEDWGLKKASAKIWGSLPGNKGQWDGGDVFTFHDVEDSKLPLLTPARKDDESKKSPKIDASSTVSAQEDSQTPLLHRSDLSGVLELAKENQKNIQRSDTAGTRFSNVASVASVVAPIAQLLTGRPRTNSTMEAVSSKTDLPSRSHSQHYSRSHSRSPEEFRRLETKLEAMEESYKRMEGALEKLVHMLTPPSNEALATGDTTTQGDTTSPGGSSIGLVFEQRVKSPVGKSIRRKT